MHGLLSESSLPQGQVLLLLVFISSHCRRLLFSCTHVERLTFFYNLDQFFTSAAQAMEAQKVKKVTAYA